mmetsp:Transcript_2963/g.11322  ORF Transcript_2963/g.11322 Transcript_2963/m.11322 type:complete len:227 (+) Transcript_2963:309-989(+)
MCADSLLCLIGSALDALVVVLLEKVSHIPSFVLSLEVTSSVFEYSCEEEVALANVLQNHVPILFHKFPQVITAHLVVGKACNWEVQILRAHLVRENVVDGLIDTLWAFGGAQCLQRDLFLEWKVCLLVHGLHLIVFAHFHSSRIHSSLEVSRNLCTAQKQIECLLLHGIVLRCNLLANGNVSQLSICLRFTLLWLEPIAVVQLFGESVQELFKRWVQVVVRHEECS